MMLPTIHWNGTTRDRLVERLTNVTSALQDALDAFAEATPDGRDYYPQGEGALTKAQNENLGRMKRVQAVKKEVENLAVAISDLPQPGER